MPSPHPQSPALLPSERRSTPSTTSAQPRVLWWRPILLICMSVLTARIFQGENIFLNLTLHFWKLVFCLVQRRYLLNVFEQVNDEKYVCQSKVWEGNQYGWNEVDEFQNSRTWATLKFPHGSPCHLVKVKPALLVCSCTCYLDLIGSIDVSALLW